MNNTVWWFKDKPYKIFEYTKIKIGEEWIKGIIYITLYPNPDGSIWVRTEEDFLARFKTHRWEAGAKVRAKAFPQEGYELDITNWKVEGGYNWYQAEGYLAWFREDELKSINE